MEPDGEGWEVLTLGYQDPDSLAARLAGYGSAVVALDPPEVRDAVIRRLKAIAEERPAQDRTTSANVEVGS